MKIELDINDETVDEILIQAIKDGLRYRVTDKNAHPEELEASDKFYEAAKVVLEYYGGN